MITFALLCSLASATLKRAVIARAVMLPVSAAAVAAAPRWHETQSTPGCLRRHGAFRALTEPAIKALGILANRLSWPGKVSGISSLCLYSAVATHLRALQLFTLQHSLYNLARLDSFLDDLFA